MVDNNNGCTMHVLEAGFEEPGRPCVLLLHGFPELAFSWRKQLMFLAAAGYHVVAPDQRGYGRSGGAGVAFEDDLMPYSLINRVSDTVGLVKALGYDHVDAVIGHDYGSPVSAWCALLRPDVFRAVVLMSAAFPGAPVLPKGTAGRPGKGTLPLSGIPESLAALPRPRKHYRWYYSTAEANEDMWHCPQGVHAFLRAYFHYKSGDWPGNAPFPLASWAASELARLPTYYVMELGENMAETVAPHMPGADDIAACEWLTEAEMAVYSDEYGRTGFQGGLQGYRVGTDPRFNGELKAFSDRTIDVPAMFVSGARDWGTYQSPGALERMAGEICTQYRGTHLVEGAGHWVQQERPEEVNALLADFLRRLA
ncbi:alpha/beta hydrolase [Ramlibacter alkalitolerans]|uniref:Alpha/beta hydrolase n=1 Tax=Ramlibacter alkalitolerans TaxID=2039631 RepID=A0ABS1JIK0_9BURK|nr:alpha/beta hydrolase [Ramlibacter alkalitolerans]